MKTSLIKIQAHMNIIHSFNTINNKFQQLSQHYTEIT